MNRSTYKRPPVFRSWHVRSVVRTVIRWTLAGLAGIVSGLVIVSPILAAILT